MVCQRWWVTKWCVKDGVSKMVGDKVGCERWCGERWCVTKLCAKGGVWQSGASHQSHQSQPSATSAPPATQNEGGCHQVPHLPRKVGRRHRGPIAPKRATRASPVPEVPRLPRKTKVDVTKWHACHANEGGCRQVLRLPHAKLGGVTGDQARPSAPPEPAQCHKLAISATSPTQNEGGCHQVPRLPCETKVDVAKCHACHAKLGGVTGAISATPAMQNEGGCHQVPRLPRETKVDVAKCHACHAKLGSVTGDQARPSAPPEPAQCHKCHACHVERRWMSPSATLAR